VDETAREALEPGEASGPAERPANFVAGVFHDRSQFHRALEELVTLGVRRESIGVLYGERGAEGIAHRPRHWLREMLSDEVTYVERYEQEIRQGGFVVGVPIDRHINGQRERVREILESHGAHYIVSSTPWTHEVGQ
jgi:hypothetical protein